LRPFAADNFRELKPQKTGTGLLIRFGEVVTTSGSTSLRLSAAMKKAAAPKCRLRRRAFWKIAGYGSACQSHDK